MVVSVHVSIKLIIFHINTLVMISVNKETARCLERRISITLLTDQSIKHR